MYDKDPYQKIKAPGYGQAIRAADLKKIVALILQCVKGGKGILVERAGQSVIIRTEDGPRGGRGGGGGGADYTAASRALLDAYTGVVDYARGRVTAGADAGTAYIRNPDNDGWVALNRLE